MNALCFKHKGVKITFVFDDLLKARKSVILMHGMPGEPPKGGEPYVKKLIKRGYFVFIPQYLGSFDSDGYCTFSNAADTVLNTIDFIKKGKGKELWSDIGIKFKSKEIILIGASFGGSTVLVAGAKSKDVKKIVALAPVTTFKRGKKEHDLTMDESRICKRVYPHTWRFNDYNKIWKRYAKGNIDLNAMEYLTQLRKKKVLLVHSAKDDVVEYFESVELQKKIKCKLLTLKGADHLGLSALKKKRVWKEVDRLI